MRVDIASDLSEEAASTLTEAGAAEVWSEPGGAFGAVVNAVMGAERTGRAIDLLHERLSSKGGLRALVLTLDAVFPRPAASPESAQRKERSSAAAVSREEVYASVSGNAVLSPAFLALVVLATIVAAIGMTTDNTAAVIGAMVVAPLLGPNMALALGLTLADRPLLLRALRSSAAGIALCFGVAVTLAFCLDVDPKIAELSSRAGAELGDVALAVAAGAAGTLAYTSGAPTYLVGVMVAVALLPPTVASGLFLGSGLPGEAAGAALLASINAVALVLASMLTFLVRGMRPRAWWKQERARTSAWHGGLALAALLLLLVALLVLSDHLLVKAGP